MEQCDNLGIVRQQLRLKSDKQKLKAHTINQQQMAQLHSICQKRTSEYPSKVRILAELFVVFAYCQPEALLSKKRHSAVIKEYVGEYMSLNDSRLTYYKRDLPFLGINDSKISSLIDEIWEIFHKSVLL